MPGIVKLDYEGPVAFVNLSHPGKLNAMSCAMWRELHVVFQAIQGSPDVRCVVVRGEAGTFCAGGDINEYPAFRFDPESLRSFHENDVWAGLEAMLECDVPVVAQIEGACMGAGLEIASCCDIRIAGDSSRFGAPIAKLGFPMAPREAHLVLSAVGNVIAREMLLEAAVLGSHEMRAHGFLTRITPDFGVAAEVAKTVQRIVALAPEAARMNKQTLRALRHGPATAQAWDEVAYDYAPSEEHREGIQAFLEKRKPDF